MPACPLYKEDGQMILNENGEITNFRVFLYFKIN